MTLPERKPRLIAIVGPTGVGKTEMAIKLASEWNGEIISADSMQVYRMMDIGTAKPSLAERAIIRHHLIDVVNPDETFHAARFIRMAREIIAALHAEKTPIFIVGGSGLYIKTLLGGLLKGPGADDGIRTFYRRMLENHGKAYLYDKLKEKDEQAAARIDANDTVRIIRALEVWELSGESIVEKQLSHGFRETSYACLKIGLRLERHDLYARIDERTDQMVRAGFMEEVWGLLHRGYHERLKPMQALGYKHMVRCFKGIHELDETVRLMKRDTRHYAKRQMTWFSADGDVEWMSPRELDVARERVASFLSR